MVLFLKYLNWNLNYNNLSNINSKNNINELITSSKNLLYIASHIKLSSLFYSYQLIDIFSYEIPHSYNKNQKFSICNSYMIVYNFYSWNDQNRLVLYINLRDTNNLNSLNNLFPSSNWLEREVSELYGINFIGKNDLRNLMLQYGDTNTPFKKSFPTIGLKEMFYNPIVDSVTQNNISVNI